MTADYLFQYEVFDIHTHDEIEQSTQTHKKIESILLHLEKKSNDEFNIFMEVLKISKQEFILNELRKREGSVVHVRNATGTIPDKHLQIEIEEIENPPERVVKIINSDPTVRVIIV